MSKKSLLNKVIALTAVTTLVAVSSISALAATYGTTTTYVKGGSNITVKTTVSDLTIGDEYTYLAGEASAPVYINQYAAAGTSEEFSYTATRSNIGAAVKMAKVDSTFANGAAITPATEGANTVPSDTTKAAITASVEGGTAVVGTFNTHPYDIVAGDIVPVTVSLTDSKYEVKSVKVNDVDASCALVGEAYQVTLPTLADYATLSIVFTTGLTQAAEDAKQEFEDAKDEEVKNEGTAKPVGIFAFNKTSKLKEQLGTKEGDAINVTVNKGDNETETVDIATYPVFALYGASGKDKYVSAYGIAVKYEGEESFTLYRAADCDSEGAYAVAIIDNTTYADGEVPPTATCKTYKVLSYDGEEDTTIYGKEYTCTFDADGNATVVK